MLETCPSPAPISTTSGTETQQIQCEGRASKNYLTMSLAKPVMRGLLGKRLRFHLPIAFALSLLAAVGFKYTVTEPRKQAYAEFYKHYDATKEFNAMREAGIFTSVRPTGE
ncbi:cytochrome c oxidase subunit 6C [Eucyclogobius newberryi]|uniref:cytochrome c oxidase subunit 6C n=1 Tax=Eucyclogobius newberryi TaxID=166745 RepID=UPI003B5CE6D9